MVEVKIPDDLPEQILAALQPMVDRGLSVVNEVEGIIKEVAVIEEKDVNGQPITPKKPKPVKTPRNLPNAPLIGKPGVHEISMLDPTRFTTQRDGPYQATMTYQPPDYFIYVIEKRPWLTHDQMNDDARARIERRMRDEMEGIRQ